jgi:D-alanyl-lipoteichoic acid acyltransferase DltB (MBOAT superfamily)
MASADKHAGGSPRSYRDQLRADLEAGRLLRLGAIATQFALIVAAIRLLNIETKAFEQILTLALGGFLVNHFLPAAWRQSFFGALSVTSVLMVFGWAEGARLLGIGGLLIALCHLPVSLRVRIMLVLLVAGVLAAGRMQVLPSAPSYVPTILWPILGSMFMFRLVVYLYDLKHKAAPFGVGRALSYFFMLPNVCFPLFPLVDYKTFQRSAYNEDALRVYQTGARWMLRGLVHLSLYKVVYFMGIITPSEAVDGVSAGRYMLMSYLLYLKISGLYHFIVGLLHMYGFNLPETHHQWLLSSSFTDFWRRTNIYWKDFIQKLVFNPAYFMLRKLGEARAMAIATAVTAVLTWLLHSYQWFWIRGNLPIIWADVVFWGSLGVGLLISVIWERRSGRIRSLEKPVLTFREQALLCVKTACFFTFICILWTIWNTPNVNELEMIARALLNSGPRDVAVILAVPLGLGVIRVLFEGSTREVFGDGRDTKAARAFWPQAAMVSVIAAALMTVALRPEVLLPVSPPLARLVKDVREGHLNPADMRKLQRGYYEDLGDVTRFDGELWIMYGGRPKGWNDSPQTRDLSDATGGEFIPSTAAVFKGALRTINSHGMRDREYTLERGPDTFRIALVGASHDMGSGVKDDETYENVVEDRLNRELGPRTGKKFEILNFSQGGFSPTQKLAVIEQRIFRFQPDVILYVAYGEEFEWTFRSVPHLAKNQLLDQFPFIKSAMDRAGIKAEPGKAVPDRMILNRKLAPYAEEALRALVERFRDGAASRGMRPALVLIETPDDSPLRPKNFDRLVGLGQSAKLPVLDLQGSFAGVKDRKSLWITPWDTHSNAQGHRLLADRLYSLLLKQGLVPTEPPPAAHNESTR